MPSRGRPEKSKETYLKWQSSSTSQFILSLDYDDPHMNKYRDIFPDYFKLKPMPPGEGKWGRCFSDDHVIIINKNRSAVDAINKAAEVAIGEIYIVVSDDTEPCNAWPWHIYNEANGRKDWIMKTQDGIQPWIITMPVMDRDYYNRFGYIYHPDYKHLFCDTELTCVADITGRKITSNLLFPHNHYSIGKSVKDEISIRADATQQEGERLFIERYKRNFDLPPGNKIQDRGLIDWLLKRNVHA